MALSSTTLKNELVGMGLFYSEASAASAWAQAYREYFADASAVPAGIPVTEAALGAPEAAMAAAMAGLATDGAAAIQAGVAAFWGALNPAATYFAGATSITPPTGLTGLSTALSVVFAVNIAASKSKEDSYEAIAEAIHSACAGGIAVYPAPPGGIGPQTIE